MPLFSCIPKKTQTKDSRLENILLLLCDYNTPMINADVIRFSNGFVNYDGWECDISSTYVNDNTILRINVKNKLDTLIIENNDHDECVVCTNDTNQTVKCCKQSVCLSCLKQIKKTCDKEDMSFCCPVCRKDLDNSVTTYRFDKDFLRTLTEAGENEKLKINIIKEKLA